MDLQINGVDNKLVGQQMPVQLVGQVAQQDRQLLHKWDNGAPPAAVSNGEQLEVSRGTNKKREHYKKTKPFSSCFLIVRNL